MTYTLLNMVVNTTASVYVGWMCCTAWEEYRRFKRSEACSRRMDELRQQMMDASRNPPPVSERMKRAVTSYRRLINMKIGEE